MHADDARYERPCKLMLACGALIHWVGVAVALPWNRLNEVEPSTAYARIEALMRLFS